MKKYIVTAAFALLAANAYAAPVIQAVKCEQKDLMVDFYFTTDGTQAQTCQSRSFPQGAAKPALKAVDLNKCHAQLDALKKDGFKCVTTENAKVD